MFGTADVAEPLHRHIVRRNVRYYSQLDPPFREFLEERFRVREYNRVFSSGGDDDLDGFLHQTILRFLTKRTPQELNHPCLDGNLDVMLRAKGLVHLVALLVDREEFGRGIAVRYDLADLF